jgi:hypothetical protein
MRHHHIPAYRLHKQSGQAIVTLPDGRGGRRDFTLGPYGSPESRAEYARLLGEWEANGRRVPAATPPAHDVTVNELLVDFWRWAQQHYTDAKGNPGRELNRDLGTSTVSLGLISRKSLEYKLLSADGSR